MEELLAERVLPQTRLWALKETFFFFFADLLLYQLTLDTFFLVVS